MIGPDVVVLAAWPGASRDEIEVYTNAYRRRYPGAKMETLAGTTRDASTISTHENGDIRWLGANESVLIHMFGHDAAERVCGFLRAFYTQTGRAMNVQQLIYDSAPQSFLATTFWQPYQFLVSACYLLCAPILGADSLYDDQTWTRHDLEASCLLPATVRRCYSPNVCEFGDSAMAMEAGMSNVTHSSSGIPV
ncbi:uncharacterized protein MYCFIDRAFT_212634 [Pseudocercospora fijiensis CIRAD86]|uniref:Uncharacterized protein n=1 Tax=Pseudocercospora fijiensis (strain CIRAD86) TaxID=383855 RepID=M2YK17_PSEFD|nr:uncharacterized protein MYCFIDRAFT_212634 [Pseudocercospora fijiensis CIRAD86]EME78105.1 hypothetical protein MYCFIDRAFT_212634 [Pseudocercospora fijiensis CIRAD86]